MTQSGNPSPTNINKAINSTATKSINIALQDHQYSTCSKQGIKPLQYNKVFGTKYQLAVILTQMSATKGIKVPGPKAINALANKWIQLFILSVCKGRKYDSLTLDQRK